MPGTVSGYCITAILSYQQMGNFFFLLRQVYYKALAALALSYAAQNS